MYDFKRCKLCGEESAPEYKLKHGCLYVCGRCDFHYLDALDIYPREEPDTALLNDKARNFIEGKLPQNSQQLDKSLAFVKSQLSLEGKRCLDIGAGVGVFLSLLEAEGGELFGIEPQQIFREFAAEKYGLTLRSELVEAPYWQEQFAGHFDVITLWDTLEHVNFPLELVVDAVKLLKEGGYLFLDTPSRDSFVYRASQLSYRLSRGTSSFLLSSFYSAKPYRHKQIFTKAQLHSLLEKAGLEVVGDSGFHRSGNKLLVAARKKEKTPS